MNTLKYKDYQGSVEFDADRMVLRGKILLISDLITYESPTAPGLQAEFEAAVEDYLQTCLELGRDAQKPFSGVFNVRVEPDCHKALAHIAASEGRSLNATVADALRHFILERQGPTKRIEHVHRLAKEDRDGIRQLTASASTALKWEPLDVEVH